MNIKGLGAASFELGPGFHLRRATADEIIEIKKTLNTLPVSDIAGSLFSFPNLWERPWPHGNQLPATPLPAAEWRYFVIASPSPCQPLLWQLCEILDLVPTELEVGFMRTYHPSPPLPPEAAKIISDLARRFPNLVGGALTFEPDRLFQFIRQSHQTERLFVEIGREQAEQIAHIRSLTQQNDAKLIDFNGYISQLSALKGLPRDSPLRFLGYFALLEALLTHAPVPTDPYDSITRQIKKKLTLLERRLLYPIDYSGFSAEKHERIWAKMYDYRSKVAHGGKPNFTNEHKLLKSHECALNLVRETAKAVITQALREPQLILDLREC
jgi:hypothetical protein